MGIKFFVTLILLASSFYGQAKQTITVAFGNALAPWVMPANNTGIIVDIITQTLTQAGYTITPVYYPYLRRINSFKNNQVDVSSDMNLNTMRSEGLTGYFSGNVYQYQNYLISLSENQFNFKTIEDVGQHSLISWQGALTHLGTKYQQAMLKNPNYTETHDQTLQVKMLFLKRFDIAQMDLQIFKYYRQQIDNSGRIDTSLKVDLFPVLGASPNGFLFKDKEVRDAFVKELAKLKANGGYQKIFDKYTAN